MPRREIEGVHTGLFPAEAGPIDTARELGRTDRKWVQQKQKRRRAEDQQRRASEKRGGEAD